MEKQILLLSYSFFRDWQRWPSNLLHSLGFVFDRKAIHSLETIICLLTKSMWNGFVAKYSQV
jgi:hypothetical protein